MSLLPPGYASLADLSEATARAYLASTPGKRSKKPKRPGPPKGHPGWGGRPKGLEMPCGWGCGEKLTVGNIRAHFKICPKRPAEQ